MKSKSTQIDFISMKTFLYDELNKSDKHELISNINPKNILSLITYTMSVIDKYSKNASGLNKKQMCLNLIYDVIENTDTNPETKEYIINILNNFYDPFVENIIEVSKGYFNINKATNFFTKLINIFKNCSCTKK